MKDKICISIDHDMLCAIDIEASRIGISRSAYIESMLRSTAVSPDVAAQTTDDSSSITSKPSTTMIRE